MGSTTAEIYPLDTTIAQPYFWMAPLPIEEHSSSADLHLKFNFPWKQSDQHIMFHIHFEGILYPAGKPLSFRVFGYLNGNNGLINFSNSTESGPVKVTKAYESQDGFMCFIVSSGGESWHASELSARLVGGANIYTQRAKRIKIIQAKQSSKDAFF